MLSDVNIRELNQQATDTYISTATYSTLLHHLVEKSPIFAIVDDINTQLALIVKSDKSNIESLLVNKAYASQMQQDIEENQSDVQEMRNDLLLSSQLTLEAAALTKKISTYGLRIQNDCANIDYLQNKIRELNQKIANYGATHHQKSTDPHKQTTHEHGNTEVSLEKQKLRSLKKRLDTELSLVQKNLNEIQLEYNNTKDHAQTIEKSLTRELPKKAQQRNERAIKRTAREDAHRRNASRKQQLAPNNYQLLVQAIAIAHQNIDKQEKRLNNEVAKQSYKLFVARIEIYLKSESKLSYHETEALKQIIIHMHNHFEVLEKRTVEMEKLERAQSNENRLIGELQQEEQKRHQLKIDPILESQSQQLLEQNQQLEKAIEQRHTLNNKLLKISVFTFFSTGALLGGAFLAMKLLLLAVSLIPLLFIPAGIMAIATIGLLIASLVYTAQSNSDKSRLKQNSATITSNSELISNKNNTIKMIEQVTIPSLKAQLNDTEQLVTGLEQRISDLEREAELFLNKARNVNPTATKDPNFIFTPPPEPTPSASPSKEDIDFVSVTFGP